MRTAFNGFVDALLPGTPTEFALVDFGTIAHPGLDFTNNAALIKTTIDATRLPGTQSTNWEQGLLAAYNYLAGPNNRPDHPDLVIFASDGNPNEFVFVSGIQRYLVRSDHAYYRYVTFAC